MKDIKNEREREKKKFKNKITHTHTHTCSWEQTNWPTTAVFGMMIVVVVMVMGVTVQELVAAIELMLNIILKTSCISKWMWKYV